jgi:hypothetical protein
MDVKWLFIVFCAVLGVFRALRPVLFKQWITLRWSELDDARLSISASIIGALMPATFILIIVQALEVKVPLWKGPVLLIALLVGRIFFSVIMSFLFSGSVRLRFRSDILGGIPISLMYALVALIILVLVLINSPWQSRGLYLLCTGHLIGLLWSGIKSPLLQNISNTGPRFYAMSYLCTLELVLIFSFVN